MTTPATRKALAALEALRKTGPELAALLRKHRAEVAALDKYREDFRADLAAEVTTRMRREVDVLQGLTAERTKWLQEALSEARSEVMAPGASPEEQLLGEMRLQRAWERHRPALEARTAAPGDLAEYVRSTLATADRDTVRAFAEEVPAWAANAGLVPQTAQVVTKAVEEAISRVHPDGETLTRITGLLPRFGPMASQNFAKAAQALDGDTSVSTVWSMPDDDGRVSELPITTD